MKKKRKKDPKPKAPKAKKQYCPGLGTANYAFLIVLFKVVPKMQYLGFVLYFGSDAVFHNEVLLSSVVQDVLSSMTDIAIEFSSQGFRDVFYFF